VVTPVMIPARLSAEGGEACLKRFEKGRGGKLSRKFPPANNYLKTIPAIACQLPIVSRHLEA